MEKDFRRHIQKVYFEISSMGLSAKLSRLNTLGKFQNSVSYSEALLALDLLFRLCDLFQCTDIPELFELFYIHEYWQRQEHTILVPTSIKPDFQIDEKNTVMCTLARSPQKGCLECSHFDACEFPRTVSSDDLSAVNWRCVECGNPLEFPAVLYQSWITRTHNVKIEFLCCSCFMDYSVIEEGRKEIERGEFTIHSPLPVDPHIDPAIFSPNWMNFEDLVATTLGFFAILLAQFEDPRSALYQKVPHPAPQDEIAWEVMQIATSQMSLAFFTYLAEYLPNILASPRLGALFEYCYNFLEPQDIIFLEDRKDIVYNFSYKFRDFIYALVKSTHISNIIAALRADQPSWEKLNAWVASRFI